MEFPLYNSIQGKTNGDKAMQIINNFYSAVICFL